MYLILTVLLILKDILKKKIKITKLLNSEENSKRKVPNQMTKSNNKTHQTTIMDNYCHIPDLTEATTI